jgi:TonB family protein
MISRMVTRSVSLLFILFAMIAGLFVQGSGAQKCKGMEVKYENEIQYPNSARAARIQGEVALQVHIATDGTVTADIVSGPSVLAESAKRFVETWSVPWPKDAPPTACAPVLHVSYKLKSDNFNVKTKLPTHIVVEAPPIETNEPTPH